MFRVNRYMHNKSIYSVVRPYSRFGYKYKANHYRFFSTTPFVYMSDKEEEKKDNAFIASLMSNKNWLTNKMEWPELPSVDDINAKLNQLYPEFTSQFTHLHDNYQKLWDYLTMEDFRKIVDELVKEQNDPNIYPEITKDASVR